MSGRRYLGSVLCPICGRHVSLKANGRMYRHGPSRACQGATDYIVESSDSPRAREVVGELRRLWRIGDALAASNLTGIPYSSPVLPERLSVEQELAALVADARAFITDVAQRIGAGRMVSA